MRTSSFSILLSVFFFALLFPHGLSNSCGRSVNYKDYLVDIVFLHPGDALWKHDEVSVAKEYDSRLAAQRTLKETGFAQIRYGEVQYSGAVEAVCINTVRYLSTEPVSFRLASLEWDKASSSVSSVPLFKSISLLAASSRASWRTSQRLSMWDRKPKKLVHIIAAFADKEPKPGNPFASNQLKGKKEDSCRSADPVPDLMGRLLHESGVGLIAFIRDNVLDRYRELIGDLPTPLSLKSMPESSEDYAMELVESVKDIICQMEAGPAARRQSAKPKRSTLTFPPLSHAMDPTTTTTHKPTSTFPPLVHVLDSTTLTVSTAKEEEEQRVREQQATEEAADKKKEETAELCKQYLREYLQRKKLKKNKNAGWSWGAESQQKPPRREESNNGRPDVSSHGDSRKPWEKNEREREKKLEEPPSASKGDGERQNDSNSAGSREQLASQPETLYEAWLREKEREEERRKPVWTA